MTEVGTPRLLDLEELEALEAVLQMMKDSKRERAFGDLIETQALADLSFTLRKAWTDLHEYVLFAERVKGLQRESIPEHGTSWYNYGYRDSLVDDLRDNAIQLLRDTGEQHRQGPDQA